MEVPQKVPLSTTMEFAETQFVLTPFAPFRAPEVHLAVGVLGAARHGQAQGVQRQRQRGRAALGEARDHEVDGERVPRPQRLQTSLESLYRGVGLVLREQEAHQVPAAFDAGSRQAQPEGVIEVVPVRRRGRAVVHLGTTNNANNVENDL